jgi:hypothetical protein
VRSSARRTTQNHPQPREHEAKVVTDGAEDDVGGIAGATFEIAAAEMTFCLHMSDHRLDGGAPSELAFDAAEDPAQRSFSVASPRERSTL